jgi:hypothetical protein
MTFSQEYQMRELRRLTDQRDTLLAALEAVAATIEWHWKNKGDFVGDMMDALPDIRAAIAKAEGETK